MLKLINGLQQSTMPAQPPSGGCVLKPLFRKCNRRNGIQPPSGGCVLKQFLGLILQMM